MWEERGGRTEEGRREGGGEAEGRTNVGARELEGRKLGGGRREGGDIGDIGGSREEEGGGRDGG